MSMENILQAIQMSLNNSNWYGALFSALTLPDICGKLENSNTRNQIRYIDWFDKYLGGRYSGFLSGNDCYALRCSYLHEGIDDITGQRVRDVLDKFIFLPDGSHCNYFKNSLFGDPKYDGKSFLQLSVKKFCGDLIGAASQWISDVKDNEDIQNRISNILVIHVTGIRIGGLTIK